MINTIAKYTFWILFYILVQTLIINNINLWGIAAPQLYIYTLLILPATLSRNLLLTIGFLVGLTIDIFCNTLGMHTLAIITAAFLQKPILSLFHKRGVEVEEYSIRTLGVSSYMKFCSLFVLTHHLLLFTIEYFSIFNFYLLFFKGIASAIVTTLLIFLIENLKLSLGD
ncbi:rod shape-determining protein MreD [Porphyromonadaceae bacterium]